MLFDQTKTSTLAFSLTIAISFNIHSIKTLIELYSLVLVKMALTLFQGHRGVGHVKTKYVFIQ